MRLSDWRVGAPHRESLGPRVMPVLEPVLETLGAESNPHVWIAWGDDPGFRYTLFAPTPAGLGVCSVRLNLGSGSPRIAAKLVRWGRVQLGELDVETQESHRLVTVQLEGQVLKGVDADADRVAAFIRTLLGAIDGHGLPVLDETPKRRGASKGRPTKTSRSTSPRATRVSQPADPGSSRGRALTNGRPDAASPEAGAVRRTRPSARRPPA
jgi:hypothetical protein